LLRHQAAKVAEVGEVQSVVGQSCVVAVVPWLGTATASHLRGPTVLWKSETFYLETQVQTPRDQEPLAGQRPWRRQVASLVSKAGEIGRTGTTGLPNSPGCECPEGRDLPEA